VEIEQILKDLKARGGASREAWQIKDLDYWLKSYNDIPYFLEKSEQAKARYEGRPKEGREKESAIWEYLRNAITDWGFAICVRYTGGCDVQAIRNECLVPALLNSPFYKTELERYADELPEKYFFPLQQDPDEVYDAYVFLTWCVCLDGDPALIAEIAPVIAKPGEDRLIDLILQRYDSNRTVATKTINPKVFAQLTKVIDASPANRIKLMERHLDKWAVKISKLRGVGLGGGISSLKGAKSNEDMRKEAFIKPNYTGWWAWEVALLVRVFDIDDTSFADHPLYPVELARYRDTENPVDLWPLGTAQSPGADENIEEDEGRLATLLILVSVAAGTATASLNTGHSLMAFEDDDDGNAGYLYLAVDEASAKSFGEPAKLIAGSSQMQISASVSTSERAIKFEQKAIDLVVKTLQGNWDRYLFFKQGVESDNIAHFLNVTTDDPVKGIFLPIASGDNWAAWVDAGKLPKSGQNKMTIQYAQIKNGELLSISVYNNGRDDVEVGEMVNELQRLVEMYAGHELHDI